MGYSVGIGLTNDCNLNCAHCYRDTRRVDRVSLAQVQADLARRIPVDALGMGTGENALHPEFTAIVRLPGRPRRQAEHGLQWLQPDHHSGCRAAGLPRR